MGNKIKSAGHNDAERWERPTMPAAGDYGRQDAITLDLERYLSPNLKQPDDIPQDPEAREEIQNRRGARTRLCSLGTDSRRICENDF